MRVKKLSKLARKIIDLTEGSSCVFMKNKNKSKKGKYLLDMPKNDLIAHLRLIYPPDAPKNTQKGGKVAR